MSLEQINEENEQPEKVFAHPMWKELEELRDDLHQLGDINVVKAYIKEHMTDDVAQLQKKYKADFGSVKPTDPLRLEILQTLGELGIMIY
jgi:phage host-nuclease inhibitor protein Gam